MVTQINLNKKWAESRVSKEPKKKSFNFWWTFFRALYILYVRSCNIVIFFLLLALCDTAISVQNLVFNLVLE